MSDHDLAESMELEPEYASLIVPNMVIIRNFIEIFQAEALWIPGVSLLDGIAYDYAEKNKYLKSVHNFENDILVASRNIAKRYSSGKNHIAGTTDVALDILTAQGRSTAWENVNGFFCRLQFFFMTAENISV